MYIHSDEPLAAAVVEAIRMGELPALKRLLAENPDLARARIGDDDSCGMSRTLLHIASDWPGHFPAGAATVAALVAAGADVNARHTGTHPETSLHWAASSNDVEVLDALLDAGADIEATGAVIAGGTPLSDAVAFAQWQTARRLVERGAETPFREAAALGLLDRVEERWATEPRPGRDELAGAFWYACHGGQRQAAEWLLARGAELNWISPWDELTPLDAARRSGAAELGEWLSGQGAKSAEELE